MAKKMKKVVALLLALVMIMGLSVNAFAARGLSVCSEEDHTHENKCYAEICGKTEADTDVICGKEAHDHTGCHVHGVSCDPATCAETACDKEAHAHVETCFALHVHGETCYDKANLICTKHEHTDSCFTIWHGDKVSVAVEAGKNGYTFLSMAGAVGTDGKAYCNYETSNHTLNNGGNAVSLLTMMPADRTYTWTPNGLYEYGKSNYEVLYCCDKITTYEDGIYYKRTNLEDSDYYTEEEAEHIRAIVTNSYPYVSLEEMRANLKAGGFAYADEIDRAEAITAVQAAIWYFANQNTYAYNITANVSKQSWGENLHEFTREMSEEIQNLGTWNRPTYEDVGVRVNALIDYLKKQTAVEAKPAQIVISELEIVDTIPVAEQNGVYTVALRAGLNHSGSSANDDISVTIYVDGVAADTKPVVLGTNTYDFAVEAKDGQTIKAVVSGTQFVEKSVYFYEPAPADVNGDGVATSREVSQNMVGVAEGATDVYAKAEVTLDIEVPSEVRGNLMLRKVDENGDVLAGAAFELFAIGENTVSAGVYKVDAEGLLAISGLLPGSYKLTETKAPEGYKLLTGSILFDIDEKGKVILVEGEKTTLKSGTITVITNEWEEAVTTEDDLPVISLALVPGTNPSGDVTTKTFLDEDSYVILDRTASAVVSTVDTTVNSSATGETKAVAPVYDVINGKKEDKGGMFDYQFNDGLKSTYSNPATWTDMPADADVRYVGTGEHSKYYVYCAYVEYDRNEDGSVKRDENGNYVIKELRRYDYESPALTIDGEVTTELFTDLGFNSVYDNPGGSRPFMFAMKDRDGQAYYGYCCDLDTPTSDGYYYSIANLEDSDYYASEASEKHIRSIVMNGYWGTTGIPDANGNYAFGSLELLKQKLIAYIDAKPELNTELTAPVLDRNNKYQPVVDADGNTVYATKTMKEMVEGLTSGEALLATQAAIWSYANGASGVLSGNDGSIVLDPDGYKWNHEAMKYSKDAGGYTNGEAMDDFASAAVDFLYTWLINLDTAEESTVVINDKNFIENLTLDIGNKIADTEGDDVYSVDLSFDLGFTPGEKDNLLIEVTYGDSTIAKRLAGENGEGETYAAITEKNGRYVIEGLEVPENEITDITLRLVGKQYLEHGAYIYQAHGGRKNSQNFVGVTEGEKTVDVSKTISFSYEADETKRFADFYTEPGKILEVTNVPNNTNPPVDPPAPSATSVRVNKVWVDNNDALDIRPDSISVQLYANGNAMGLPVELSAANNWSYVWSGLPAGVTYTVDEVDVPEGYAKSVSGYTITNTLTEEEFGYPDTPLAGDETGGSEEEILDEDLPLADAPATGDMTALWIAASAVSAAGILFLGKKNKDEE